MAFLTATDYHTQIKQEHLEKLTEGNDSYRLDAEGKALAQIRSRLAVRYDIATALNATGAARSAELVMYAVDMALYHLHSRISPGQVPAQRAERYQDAMEWLGKVAEGSWDAGLPLAGDADGDGVDDKNVVQWGGQAPRNPYF
jgi:phage gp36-like protein